MTRPRLNTTQRRALYKAECEAAKAAGRPHPSCNLCPHPIRPGQLWDASHDPERPAWLIDSPPSRIAHRRCNRIWNNRHDTPLFAKSNRERDKFLDIKRSRNPLPGGKEDNRKRTMSRGVVDRATGERWGAR